MAELILRQTDALGDAARIPVFQEALAVRLAVRKERDGESMRKDARDLAAVERQVAKNQQLKRSIKALAD